MYPALENFPKDGFSSSSIHHIRFFGEDDLSRFKSGKAYPKKLFADLNLSAREPVKSISIPSAYDRIETLFFVREKTKTFALHQAIRKGFEFDIDRTGALTLDLSKVSETESERILSAIASLIVMMTYEPTKFGKKAGKAKKKTTPAFFLKSNLSEARANEIFSEALSAGNAANLVRTLAELPANELRPEIFHAKAKSYAKDWGAKFEFFDRKALKKRGAGGFLAVVRADQDHGYGIAKLSYRPKGKPSGRKIALVGKGLCFDTGGYNIKTGDYMLEMHRDMTGSAVALATFGHLIKTGTTDELECYLALAENLISATAYKPNEVVVTSNGTSIEVVDTDAEGRMALSDTLVLANENNPDLIIDYATLTGAVIRAIDTRRSGVFSNQDELRELAVQAGETSGERVWGFPIGEDYWDAIESEIADVRQCATTNNADHIYAATFLSSFVKPETPWLHIDLAAESNKGGLGLSTKDVTGFGIRLTSEILRQFKPVKRAKKK